MADRAIEQIKAVYFELKALQRTPPKLLEMHAGVAEQYNYVVDELSSVSNSDYSRFKANKTWTPSRHRQYYATEEYTSKVGRLIARLNAKFSFENERRPETQTPIVVNMNQSQQMSVTVTSITNLIESVEDDEVKELLIQLQESLESKNETAARSIVQKIIDKSFEIFIKVLPYILEKWSQN